jgi:hypothetical protein
MAISPREEPGRLRCPHAACHCTGVVAGLVPPQYASRAALLLPHKKYMIENGFEGIGLALVAGAICLGLACIVLIGVGAAVLLALARADRPSAMIMTPVTIVRTTSTPQPPRKGTPTKMSRRAGAGRRPRETLRERTETLLGAKCFIA